MTCVAHINCSPSLLLNNYYCDERWKVTEKGRSNNERRKAEKCLYFSHKYQRGQNLAVQSDDFLDNIKKDVILFWVVTKVLR